MTTPQEDTFASNFNLSLAIKLKLFFHPTCMGEGPYTPLIKAILSNKIDEVKKLLTNPNLDVNKLSKYNRGGREPKWRSRASPLWYAIQGEKESIHTNPWIRKRELIHSLESTKLLLTHPNIDINKGTEGGETPFVLIVKKILLNSLYLKVQEFDEQAKELFLLFLQDERNTDIHRVYTICMDFHVLAEGTYPLYTSSLLDFLLPLFPSHIQESYTTLLEDRNFCEGLYHSHGCDIKEAVAIFTNKIEHEDEYMDLNIRSIDYIVDELRECYDRRTDNINRRIKEWMRFGFGNLSWYRELEMLIRECYTPLCIACRDDDLDRVEELLADPNIDINKQNRETGEFPLCLACEAGYFAIVERLFREELLDVNQKTARNETALYIACKNNRVSIVRLYLDHPGIKKETYTQAFSYVVQQGNEALVKLFLAKFRETAKCRDPRNKLYRQAKQRALFSLEKNPAVIEAVLNEFPQYINKKLHLYETHSYRHFVTSRRKIDKKYTDITYKPITHTLFQHLCLEWRPQVLSFLLQHPAFQASNEEIFTTMTKALEESCTGGYYEEGKSYTLFHVLFNYAKKFLTKEGVLKLLKQIPPPFKITHVTEKEYYREDGTKILRPQFREIKGEKNMTQCEKDLLEEEKRNKYRTKIVGELQSFLDRLHLIEINHLANLPYLPYDVCGVVGKFLSYKEPPEEKKKQKIIKKTIVYRIRR